MASNIVRKLEEFLATKPTEHELKAWMSTLTPKEYVECALHLVRTGPTTFIQVISLEHAFKNADQLTDEGLFAQLALALDDSTEIVNEKVCPVNPGINPEPSSRFASLYNEAVRRGFQRDDIGFGMQPFMRSGLKLDPFMDPEWKRFEQLVARIHIALCRDAQVNWSEKLIDLAGVERQIDVTIRTSTGPHKVLGLVQCKFEKMPVSITEVDAFVSVKKDLNAGIAIMVSRSGYQSGAEAKGKLHDVRLWTLQEAELVAWRDEMRVFCLRYPMFSEIRFYPPIPAGSFSENAFDIDFRSVLITQGNQRTTLLDVLSQMIHNAAERCLPVPFWMDVNFPNGELLIARKIFPLERVEINFTRVMEIERRQQMKIPIGSSYSFKSTAGDDLVIAERDLPPLDSRSK